MDLCFLSSFTVLLLISLVFLYDAAVAVAATECRYVERKALQCVKKPQIILEGDVELAKKYCHDNSWHQAVDCLQDLMDVCPSDTMEGQRLRKYVNVDNTRKSVNYLCENLGAFDKHSGCIKEGHKEISLCTDREMKRFKQPNSKELDKMESLCQFTKIAFDCLEKVLEYRCGAEANNFLFNVMTGLLPTECQENGSATIHLPSGWTLLLISLANVFLYVAEQS